MESNNLEEEEDAVASLPPSSILDLEDDAISSSLGFLDASSLVRSEMSNKRIKGAAEGAWVELDTSLEKNENEIRADGSTARERVIKSCVEYRHYVASLFAEEVDNMTIKQQFGTPILGGVDTAQYDFFVRFASYEKLTSTSLLAHGLFNPNERVSAIADSNRLSFDLVSCDLTGWQQTFTSWFEENHWSDNNPDFEGIVVERFYISVTVVAINRRTLARNIFFKNQEHSFCFYVDYDDGITKLGRGAMHFFVMPNQDGDGQKLSFGARDERDHILNDDMAWTRFFEFHFKDGIWRLVVYDVAP